MKTSFARTFQDIQSGTETTDAVFPSRTTIRSVTESDGTELSNEQVCVISSYDEELGMTEEVSTLLVDPKLRKKYENIQHSLENAKNELLMALKQQAKTKMKISEISERIGLLITDNKNSFWEALVKVKDDVKNLEDKCFENMPFDLLFNDKVSSLFKEKDFAKALNEYVMKLNELLDKSTFFNRDSFSYYNAENVTKALRLNGFFKAKHQLILHNQHDVDSSSEDPRFISNDKDLNQLIQEEKTRMYDDPELKERLLKVEKVIIKNAECRAFYGFIKDHVEILPELMNRESFEAQIWKAYIKVHEDLFIKAITAYTESKEEKSDIEEEAVSQKTRWEYVINLFNARFSVPFRLSMKNRAKVILGVESLPVLSFEFSDGNEKHGIEKTSLLKVLSNGEKKALYILNVLFEVEERRGDNRDFLFVVDDIADSFDYKNKYAILQYLKEMSETANFELIILTHNFDFFRSLENRHIAGYKYCKVAYKEESCIHLQNASGLNNPFIKDFKMHFADDPLRRVASIPFMRNLIEYTRGDDDPDYLMLTSLLHWKTGTMNITQRQLDETYLNLFGQSLQYNSPESSVVKMIFTEADYIIQEPENPELAHKLVLSMAIRLLVERYMIDRINNIQWVTSISKNQTGVLFQRFMDLPNENMDKRELVNQAVLMTPESIHVNAFMYEPIIDLSDEPLRNIYTRLKSLIFGVSVGQ